MVVTRSHSTNVQQLSVWHAVAGVKGRLIV